MILKLVINFPESEVEKALERDGMSRKEFEQDAKMGLESLFTLDPPLPGTTCVVTIE